MGAKYAIKESSILDVHSEWVGDSLIRTVVRHFGKRNKVMVDVMEFAPRYTSKQRATKAAVDAARRVGCLSVDYSVYSEAELTRQCYDSQRSKPEHIKIRTTTFAFPGIAE